mmetsp:Transcript_2634/g.8822  ORF Transcript_2634/g.8822 Transcript_2634/m.8822 type:complete len:86 (+) Transcript_2634:515-772(+)
MCGENLCLMTIHRVKQQGSQEEEGGLTRRKEGMRKRKAGEGKGEISTEGLRLRKNTIRGTLQHLRLNSRLIIKVLIYPPQIPREV